MLDFLTFNNARGRLKPIVEKLEALLCTSGWPIYNWNDNKFLNSVGETSSRYFSLRQRINIQLMGVVYLSLTIDSILVMYLIRNYSIRLLLFVIVIIIHAYFDEGSFFYLIVNVGNSPCSTENRYCRISLISGVSEFLIHAIN